MELKLKVHPLFFIVGIYYGITGRIFIFLIYTLSCVIHELGHSFVAERRGYRLDKITLMPFGAVVSGEEKNFSSPDQIVIALFGPLINLFIAIIFVALWWFFPDTYSYTLDIVEANVGLFIINLIPAFPLDGGRILFSVLRLKLSEKTSSVVCKVLGLITAISLVVCFIRSLYDVPNVSMLIFALFCLVGIFDNKTQNRYVKLFLKLDDEKLKRGVKVKRFALDSKSKIKRLIYLIDTDVINEVEVFEDGKIVKTLTQSELNGIIYHGKLNESIGDFLYKNNI